MHPLYRATPKQAGSLSVCSLDGTWTDLLVATLLISVLSKVAAIMIWKDEARFGGFLGFSRQEYWSGLPFPSPVDHIFVRTLHHNPSILDGPTWHPRTPWTVWKGKKIGHWKMNSPGQYMPNMLLEISGEITPKDWSDGAKAKTPSWGRDWG